MKLQIMPAVRRQRSPQAKKLNVKALGCPIKAKELMGKLERCSDVDNMLTAGVQDIEEIWSKFRDTTYSAAAEVLGFVKRKHQDWFDENDVEIHVLLKDLHESHRKLIADKQSSKNRNAYQAIKHTTQRHLRAMKNKWWDDKANEMQAAADAHNTKVLFEGLRAIYGPRANGSTPILKSDSTTLLTDKGEILARWAEHFNSLLNRQSIISDKAIDGTPQLPVMEGLGIEPSNAEVITAIKQLSTGKAPGQDGIPPEVYKCGGTNLVARITKVFCAFWSKGRVAQDLKDASIIHLYKRKGNRSQCDNHRGISLLSIAGKILARVVLNRITSAIINEMYPESQCGFRSGRGTADMIFAYRQLQEKCQEQNKPLYTVFVDLTKAFDTVSRPGLWKLLHKIGCPDRLIDIIQSFHDGMMGRVFDSGKFSEPFTITNGAKQGCVLAPTLLVLYLPSCYSMLFMTWISVSIFM